MYLLGFDIGGTKCAVTTANWEDGNVTLLKKEKCPTDKSISPVQMIDRLISMADSIIEKKPDAIGVSCGGPLDSKRGIILNPPNLQGWIDVEIVKQIEAHYGVPTKLQNDANACAVAEWRFGAGRGYQNLVFLTFGTGMGAGLILDGKLYTGTNDGAGEVGHIRLSEDGPEGYGKKGSFEGFCSGGGIKKLAELTAIKYLEENKKSSLFKNEADFENLTAVNVAKAMYEGDEFATAVYKKCAEYLGRGLSVIIDIINPEAIVIGSIFERNEEFFQKEIKDIIEKEALTDNAKSCKILSAELGDSIGDFASLGLLF